MKSSRIFAVSICVRTILLFLLLAPIHRSWAQEAPTGDHYGGRQTDTGYGGTLIGSTGDFAGTIPLDLPRERSGIPIPLRVTYHAHHMGAAGLGWDVPLSYILQNHSFAHRRPVYDGSAQSGYSIPQPRARASLELMGYSGELLQNGTTWVLRNGSLELEVRKSNGNFIAYDGAGRIYTFSRPTEFGAQGMWLLRSIRGASGRTVSLDYDIAIRHIDGGQGLELNLRHMAYNTGPGDSCAKNEITLSYGNTSPTPLALSMLGSMAMVRFRTLTQIDVLGRATCQSPLERLRRIVLTYLPDADTQLPQLSNALMYGRQDTAEASTPLPLGGFTYGTATQSTDNGRVLKYATTQSVPLPTDADDNEASWMGLTKVDQSLWAPGVGQRNGLWESFIDVDGDGRPDFVYKRNGKLVVQLNHATTDGASALGSAAVSLQDATFNSGPLATHTSSSQRFWYGSAKKNTVNVWRRTVDVNGDGRMDVIDAGEEAHRWVIYLNTPGGPNGIKWERRSISIKNLEAELASRGYTLESGYVPLSRRTTGVTVNGTFCLQRPSASQPWAPSYDGNIENSSGTVIVHCDHGVPDTAPPPVCIQPQVCAPDVGVEKTFVEWDLLDMNGDGYPDFVYNSQPADFFVAPGSSGLFFNGNKGWFGQTTSNFRLPTNTGVRAAFNILGVHLDSAPDESSPFARSIPLNLPDVVANGVAVWMDDGSGTNQQIEAAGFADVNGDGLVDRVVGHRAYLGVYTGTAESYSNVYLTLPDQGYLSAQWSNRKDRCKTHDDFNSTLTEGVRDITGDGIPDYYHNGKVFIGTGSGFVESGVPIVAPVGVKFSDQRESCEGRWSETDGGFYDIDGDGKPEMITIVNGNQDLFVAQLTSNISARAPEAGRLTDVANGYGAITHIAYQSAKEDLYSGHRVPFAEIVATGVSTRGTQNLGGTLAGFRYAYGNAELRFDSQLDAFSFSGYGRTVALQLLTGKGDQSEGMATVVDYWPLETFQAGMTKDERWLREKRPGHPRDEYRLRQSTEIDPWALLHIDANDSRIIGNRHTEWAAKLFELPASTANAANLRECLEMVVPYDFDVSAGYAFGANGLSPCRAHGFLHTKTVETYHGASPPPSANNVQTRLSFVDVDAFGRTIKLRDDNDVFRDDDDICIENSFASPQLPRPRVLFALAARLITDCDKHTIFASEAFGYDHLPSGKVMKGRITSHFLDRRATDDGTLLGSVQVSDATYNGAGNLTSMRTERDGLVRTLAIDYDPFQLMPIRTTITGTGLTPQIVMATLDPVSLDVLTTLDTHHLVRGTQYDGFGRPFTETLSIPNGPSGVTATIAYEGFDVNPAGRHVVRTWYRNPIPPASLPGAVGRTLTTYLDELGRDRRSELTLGSDYAHDSLILDERLYDLAGRIVFIANSYPKSAPSADHFGTSLFYKGDGEVDCLVKGTGVQPYVHITDVAHNRFVTCFDRQFDNHVITTDILDAAGLQSSDPQDWVRHRLVSSAIGRELERSTIKAGTRLEYATVEHDRLGQIVAMTRFQKPGLTADPVRWSRRLDSLGRIVRLTEPESSPKHFDYDAWGELTDIHWMDGSVAKQISNQFDALGRVIRSEEKNNGLTDGESVKTFSYDAPVTLSTLLTPTFVEGRLSGAKWATGEMAMGYDALGRVNAEVFSDDEGGTYLQESARHSDDSMAELIFRLPDHGFAEETVKYGYDSAGRLRSIAAADTDGSTALYGADVVDPFGRVRKARHGVNTVFAADYEEGGRGLIKRFEVSSPAGSRRIEFGNFDALQRETLRQEFLDGAPVTPPRQSWYNDLGQLGSVTNQGGSPADTWKFVYDGLGNVTKLENTVATNDSTLSYRLNDRDRICRIEYANSLTATECNVEYDGTGAIVSEPTPSGSRHLTYFASGAIRSITQGDATAKFAYDALGRVQKLDLHSGSSLDQRRDREYGGLIARRDVSTPAGPATQLVRRIPGPGGIIATRRGAGGDWIYVFGEPRGNRFMTNSAGTFVQDVRYRPFGAATSTGAAAGTADYTTHQWNGGDSLAAFGLSHLGARIYDPMIGRFLSRDPQITAGGATGSNPYAFAMNDPVNASDPTGLDCGSNYGKECQGDQTDTSWNDLPPPPGNSGNSRPAHGIAEPQAPNVIDLGWGGYVDERTGSFRVFQGSPPALTLPLKYRAFDPNYWFRRVSSWGPPDDDPFQRKTDYDYWIESQLDPTGEYSDVASRIVFSLAPMLIPPLLAESLPLEIGLEAGILNGEAGGAATRLASELLEEGVTNTEGAVTGAGGANELAGGGTGGGMYGPFAHTLNKGGLRAIEESRQLLSTLGRYGDEAVRASVDLAGRPATEGFFAENETTLIFRTWVPPRPITPAGWALWDMEEGQALDIDLVEIHLSY